LLVFNITKYIYRLLGSIAINLLQFFGCKNKTSPQPQITTKSSKVECPKLAQLLEIKGICTKIERQNQLKARICYQNYFYIEAWYLNNATFQIIFIPNP